MDNGISKIELVLAVMTPTQRRRWRLYKAGHSLIEIAAIEGVTYQSIKESLENGKKRAKKRLNCPAFALYPSIERDGTKNTAYASRMATIRIMGSQT